MTSNKQDFPTIMQSYVHRSRYARHIPSENRRETWEETVSRYISNVVLPRLDEKTGDMVKEAILNLEVMPSMRALMTAGPALEKDNVAGYNCAYVAVDNLKVFDEILYILMCGTGVGFSVERQYISKLPEIAEEFHEVETVIKVRDSKIGWASALRQLLTLLVSGQIPKWDLSGLRPAGAVLRTFGGRSSGPEPLESLFRFTCNTIRNASGRKLTSLEVHDLVCKIAEVVVCGGVRRSALLSLSNLTDERMRKAKDGQFWIANPQRAMANNSVCYTEKPDIEIFMREWLGLVESRSGERGIFSRYQAQSKVPERRDASFDFGTNPCSEIILRSKQFCNLTEVVIRPEDTLDDLKRKVKYATILGTVQSTYTNFRYLSKAWRTNTEDERLLGVSLTGIMDHPILGGTDYNTIKDWLTAMKQEAIKTNETYAKKLGINPSTAITCVKPSGTVSQLVNSSSGIHARYSRYYIRRVRADIKDPLCEALIKAGVPHELDGNNPNAYVFSFPIASPGTASNSSRNNSTTKRDDSGRSQGTTETTERGALQQLEHWLAYDQYWCEHKPSVTINVRQEEWLEVGAWVYRNFDKVSGISFFPVDNHVYPQAPYEEITEEKYNEMMGTFPKEIDLNVYENYDSTTASQELACVGGACEL